MTKLHHVISDCILWSLTRVLERDYCIPERDYFSVKQLIMFWEKLRKLISWQGHSFLNQSRLSTIILIYTVPCELLRLNCSEFAWVIRDCIRLIFIYFKHTISFATDRSLLLLRRNFRIQVCGQHCHVVPLSSSLVLKCDSCTVRPVACASRYELHCFYTFVWLAISRLYRSFFGVIYCSAYYSPPLRV